MAQILTPNQANELHKAMIAYLSSIDAPRSSAVLREELQIDSAFGDAAIKRYGGLIERKWTSAARLQKRIMDLEAENARLRKELDSLTPIGRSKPNDPKTWLPGSPARHTLESHRAAIRCIAFHPVFSSLASGSDDCTVKIWDWELGELERTLKAHTRPVSGLDFGGPKGRTLLASCSADLSIKLWDPNENYSNVRTLSGHDHSVSAVRFLQHTTNLLMSASRDTTIRIWDISTGFCIKTIHSDNDWIRDVSPSLDGKWLVFGGRNHAAKILEVATGETKATCLGHENDIECCIFAPPASYEYLATLAGLKKPPSASSSAEFVLTGGRDKNIKLWDSRGTLIKTFIGHNNWVRGLVVHPSGKYLISVGDDKTMRCWDLSQEGKLVKTIDDAHGQFVSCVQWAPSSASERNAESDQGAGIRCIIATGSADSCVRIFTQ